MRTDTCNSVRKLSYLLVKEVKNIHGDKYLDKSEDTANVFIMRIDCHNHLQNVWIGAITKRISKYLDDILACFSEDIESRYRLSTMMEDLLRSSDKDFIIPQNYTKGHVDVLKHWTKKYHTGDL